MRVLVVEDSPVERQLTANRVKQAGGAATTVDSVGAAAEQGDHDVALLDLGLVGTQGLASLSAFRQHHPDMPLVVLTSDDSDDQARAAIRAGADDYLVKHGIQIDSLRRSLLMAIERRRPGQRADPALVRRIKDAGACVVVLFDQRHENVMEACAQAMVPTDKVAFIDMTQRAECPVLTQDGVAVIGSPVQLERCAVHALRACRRIEAATIVIDAPHMLRLYNGTRATDEFMRMLDTHAGNVGASVIMAS